MRDTLIFLLASGTCFATKAFGLRPCDSAPLVDDSPIKCINTSATGEALDTRIAKLFRKKCDQNEVIEKFRQWRRDHPLLIHNRPLESTGSVSCSLRAAPCVALASPLNSLMARASRNFEALPLINPVCVQNSMKTVAAAYAGTNVKTHYCVSQNSSPQVMDEPPCITREMGEYMAWLTTQAANCLAPTDRPIDLLGLLKQLTNESRFAFFINGKNGRGFTQMIPQAVDEMRRKEGGYKVIAAALKTLRPRDQNERKKASLDSPERAKAAACDVFRPVLESEERLQKESTGKKKEKIKRLIGDELSCSLNQPGVGAARAAILGVGLFLHYRDYLGKNGNQSLTAMARRHGVEDLSVINQATEIAYSHEGLASAIAQFRVALEKLGCSPSFKAESCRPARISATLLDINKQRAEKRNARKFSYLTRNQEAGQIVAPQIYTLQPSSQNSIEEARQRDEELRKVCLY